MTSQKKQVISIRPGVQVLNIFQHLNYKPWFALAEFVDNSIQSYLSNRAALEVVEGDQFQLRVDIEITETPTRRIVIRDNAAGIAASDYQRAFRAADVPLDRSGLSEFGMGMKSASCWFAPMWRVRSKALGETSDGLVVMDVAHIVKGGIEDIEVDRHDAPKDDHYTEIILDNVHQLPQKRTLGKIRMYLGDIYRMFLRSKRLRLTINGEDVSFTEPAVFHGPRYDTPTGAAVVWHKRIDVCTSTGVRVHGFAALREKASTARAGFGLFRRDRLIQGGGEEGWKPVELFGRANSFRSQRLFGELFVEGVAVSHTKDGFRLDDHEDELIPLLRAALDAEPIPLLTQAEKLRMRANTADLAAIATTAASETIDALDANAAIVLPALEAHSVEEMSRVDEPLQPITPRLDFGSATLVVRKESRKIQVGTEEWTIAIELTTDPAVSDWLGVVESTDHRSREITIKFSLVHPFVQRFASSDHSELEPLIRLACAIGLAQVLARKAGVGKAGVVLMNINDLLREVLAYD